MNLSALLEERRILHMTVLNYNKAYIALLQSDYVQVEVYGNEVTLFPIECMFPEHVAYDHII